MGQTSKAPSTKQPYQLALTPIMKQRDQGRVTPCYPDERCFLPSIGNSEPADLQNRLFSSTNQSCPCMLPTRLPGWGPRQKIPFGW